MISSGSRPANGAFRPSAIDVGVTVGRLAALETGVQRGARLRLDGDHAHVRADGGLDARDQPAAADRDDDRVRVRRVLLDLEPDRPGACEHERVVERVDERPPRLLDQLVEPRERVARPGRLEVDRRAVAARRGDLLLGRALPHHDQRVDALRRRGVRRRLRVVAGADRDHPATLLLGREAADLVQRAAGLERAGALEELALEPRVQRAAGEERRARQPVADGRARALDVVTSRDHEPNRNRTGGE